MRPAKRTAMHAWHDVRLLARRHRRLIAAVLFAIGVAGALGSIAPNPPPTTPVVTASHDLPAGAVLAPSDLTVVGVPPADVPSGAVAAAPALVGRQLTGAVRRGEPLTDVRLDSGPLRRPAAGLVAAPVRLADTQAAQLLRPGMRVDVLAASPATDGAPAAASVVAADVTVVAIPGAASTADNAATDVGVEGALVILATNATQARQLAQAQVSARLSAVVVG
jgi:pilus assembly protein CpaB